MSERASERPKTEIIIHNRGIKINGICSHEKASGVWPRGCMCVSHATWRTVPVGNVWQRRVHIAYTFMAARLQQCTIAHSIIIIVLTRFGRVPTKRVDRLLCVWAGNGNILTGCARSANTTTRQTHCGSSFRQAHLPNG